MQNNENEKELKSSFKRRTNRMKTHKALNIKISFETITEFEKKTCDHYRDFESYEIGENNKDAKEKKEMYYESRTNTNANLGKKSNIKRDKLNNKSDKNVKFDSNTVNKSNLNTKKERPALKKQKSNYILSRPNLNDFTEKKYSTTTTVKTTNNRRYLTQSSKHESVFINKTNNNLCKKEYDDDDWNIEHYRGYRKKTMDVSDRKKKYETKLNELTSELPKAKLVKFSYATSAAGRDDNGKRKTNQDSFVSEKNVNGIINFNIFGVMDGHGVDGHYVSQFVKKFILNKIKNHPLIKHLDNIKDIYNTLKEKGYQLISNIFCEADEQMKKEIFDSDGSGTTCVIVFQLEERLICANAGDSRAILIYSDSINDDNLVKTKVFHLSYDCKPELPKEKERIISKGGTVEQGLDDNNKPCGPFRIWVKGEDFPGIAVSRSIGDLVSKMIGVIPNPQIIEYTLTPKSKYMLICSDGIWEFINNEKAMEIGNKYYLNNDPAGLCHELTNKSTSEWLKDDVYVDDITVVAVFF